MEKTSVIFLSWKRPDNVQKIIDTYSRYDCVDEIIVWNNNKKIFINSNSHKARILNSNFDFTIYTRFLAASLARNEKIIVQDDDVLSSEKNIVYVLGMISNKDVITFESRVLNESGKYSYEPKYRLENVKEEMKGEITLTRFIGIHKSQMVNCISKYNELFSDYRNLNSDDIFLSYYIRSVGGEIKTVPIKDADGYTTLDEVNKMSGKYDHLYNRDLMISICEEKML